MATPGWLSLSHSGAQWLAHGEALQGNSAAHHSLCLFHRKALARKEWPRRQAGFGKGRRCPRGFYARLRSRIQRRGYALAGKLWGGEQQVDMAADGKADKTGELPV